MNTVQLLLVVIILAIAAGTGIYTFVKMSREQKIQNVKQWLKWAVIEAEKYLGGGTGQLKLRYVYDLAVKQYPWIVTIVSFEMFDEWVKTALVWMEDQIEKNPNIKEYVGRE